MVASLAKRKRMLLTANILLSVGIVACAAALLLWPASLPAESKHKGRGRNDNATPTAKPIRPLSHYKQIESRHLRKPLFDPKPVKVVKAPPPKPVLTVILEGTVLEPGFTYAILKNRKGETKFVGIGESFENAEVAAITENAATVDFHGEKITLSVGKKGGR